MNGDNDDLLLEWRQFLSDEAARSSDVSGNLPTIWMRIKEEGKFPLLSSIAERALILPHGNTETERVFSLRKRVLKPERNRLQDPSINGLITVKSFMLSRSLDVQSFPPPIFYILRPFSQYWGLDTACIAGLFAGAVSHFMSGCPS